MGIFDRLFPGNSNKKPASGNWTANDVSSQPKIKPYSIRAWDGERMITDPGRIFREMLPFVMKSKVVREHTDPTQVFEGDIINYGGRDFYVSHDSDYLDQPEGSEYTIISLNKDAAYDMNVLEGYGDFKVKGNVFENDYRVVVPRFLRECKLQIMRSTGLALDLERITDNEPHTEQVKKRKANKQMINNFRVEKAPPMFLANAFANGKLNFGVCCPVCGLTPIPKDLQWPHQKVYNNGVKLNLCEGCANTLNAQ
jgi:hypothetical protein